MGKRLHQELVSKALEQEAADREQGAERSRASSLAAKRPYTKRASDADKERRLWAIEAALHPDEDAVSTLAALAYTLRWDYFVTAGLATLERDLRELGYKRRRVDGVLRYTFDVDVE